MTDFKKILVPVDFSPPSMRALEAGIDLAKRFGAALCVVHVDPPFMPPALAFCTLPLHGLETVTSAVRIACEKQLGEAAKEARAAGVSDVAVGLLEGAPASEIVELAREGAYDLIVIGAHGGNAAARALLGSIAERVLREAPCAVLSVPPAAATA